MTSSSKNSDGTIEVRISVQSNRCANFSLPYSATYFLSDVVEGSTLFEVMKRARDELGLQFTFKNFPKLGAYITSVNGLKEDPDKNLYWLLYDGWTGWFFNVGASTYVCKNGDNVLLKFEKRCSCTKKKKANRLSKYFSKCF